MPLPIITILASAAPAMFRAAERLFAPKTGATKMQWVEQSIQALLDLLSTAGEAPPAPPEADIRRMLEGLLKQEKASADWQEKALLELNGEKWIVQLLRRV